MENLFFVGKTIQHKKTGLLKTAFDIMMKHDNHIYNKVFNYIDFDTFAKIKEIHSSNTYPFIPNWETYFQSHKMTIKCMIENKDPIRIIFDNISRGISKRDEHLIIGCANDPENKTLVRSPYFINLADVDYAGYYKLLKYLLMKAYQQSEIKFNASKLSKHGQAVAIESSCAYVIHEGRKILSIADCIKKEDEVGIRYLVEELGIKPTLGQMKAIERFFKEDIYDMISYYFE